MCKTLYSLASLFDTLSIRLFQAFNNNFVTMQAKDISKQLVDNCIFKSEFSRRRTKTSDCGATDCPNSSAYVKPATKPSK